MEVRARVWRIEVAAQSHDVRGEGGVLRADEAAAGGVPFRAVVAGPYARCEGSETPPGPSTYASNAECGPDGVGSACASRSAYVCGSWSWRVYGLETARSADERAGIGWSDS